MGDAEPQVGGTGAGAPLRGGEGGVDEAGEAARGASGVGMLVVAGEGDRVVPGKVEGVGAWGGPRLGDKYDICAISEGQKEGKFVSTQ